MENLRSQRLRENHKLAKERFEVYKEFKGNPFFDKNYKYSDFRRQENPFTQNIISYDVSFQVSYRGRSGHILSNPQTFSVFGYAGYESEIQEKTINMVLDSKGQKTNSNFMGKTLQAVESSTEVNINPRGIEKGQRKPTIEEMRLILNGGLAVRDLDADFKFKNHKDREGIMKLDITHFW